jgi:hypothetical protein
VIAPPPESAGISHVTTAEPSPNPLIWGVASTLRGADGDSVATDTGTGVTELALVDALVPETLVAETVTV